ncbi:hypothetical protein ACFLUU_06840 [Chloroflexota bacterium]
MSLRIIEIKSPEDILYPLEREFFEDPRVVYHGTSSIHASEIERNGWASNALPYDMRDIKAICSIYESLSFQGFSGDGYALLRAFTLGMNGNYSEDKSASFSGSYWRSRNYSASPGGETMAGVILAVKELEDLITDTELLEKHRSKLHHDLSRRQHYPGHIIAEYRAAERRLNEMEYLNQCLQQVRELKEKYEAIASYHSPVVYAVKVEPQWFETADSKAWYEIPPVARERSAEFRPNPSVHIPLDRIVARIDFSNGVGPWIPFYGETLPLPWLTTHNQTKQMWERYRRTFGGRDG